MIFFMKEAVGSKFNPNFEVIHICYNLFSDICYSFKNKAVSSTKIEYLTQMKNYLMTCEMNEDEKNTVIASDSLIKSCYNIIN